ncbi:MAG: hypothetical protein KAW12_29005 [Candidatus Aminicenantes bacterium]|nr:hypothetical protein [Candidatus Aminicenantes bacterium]
MQNEKLKKNVRILFVMGMFLVFVLSAALFVAAESGTGHLTGTIYENDGETPLDDAQIILERFEKGKKKDGKEYRSNVTDNTGTYKLENVPVGKYRGKIMVNGKHHRVKRVDFYIHILKGETNFVSFALKGKGRRK